MLGAVVVLLLSAPPQALRVDGRAGNNTLNGVFDAPLGERITATSSAVACDIQMDAEGRNLSGRCSVPLSSMTVDADPTKSDHFRQWATNRKSDPARCILAADLTGVAVSLPRSTGESSEFQAEVPFTVCGRPREDGGREHVTGTVVRLEDGWFRVRARVEHFHREAYRIGPRFTEGWLARVQSLAKVVAEEGTLELTLFAAPPEASARPRASGENAPCIPRPSTRSANQERKCRT
ncbi:MAG TPA: hypothetical protein VMH40_18870 [Myxococcaceae bacterium]|nr:hypothetical protein [Myxococcaceae bacterium]